MTDALKPCPFCGRHDISIAKGQSADGSPWYYVECDDCGATAVNASSWDTRSSAGDAAIKRVAELERDVKTGIEAARAATNAGTLFADRVTLAATGYEKQITDLTADLAAARAEIETWREQTHSYQGFVAQHADQIRELMAALSPFADAVEKSVNTHKPVACFVNQGQWEQAFLVMNKMRERGFSAALAPKETNNG